MEFSSPLLSGRIIKRYKRFLVDVELEPNQLITAHCANSGTLLNLTNPGTPCWVTNIPENKLRKLRYDLHLIQDHTSLVGINTLWANDLVAAALTTKKLFPEYCAFQREVKYGQNSRIDFLLNAPGLPPFYLEVKNVTHHQEQTAFFPDCITTRGAKHLNELTAMVNQGYRAGVIYVVQRMDCTEFKIAHDIDPIYGARTHEAKKQGVEFWAHMCNITLQNITLDQPLDIKFYYPHD